MNIINYYQWIKNKQSIRTTERMARINYVCPYLNFSYRHDTSFLKNHSFFPFHLLFIFYLGKSPCSLYQVRHTIINIIDMKILDDYNIIRSLKGQSKGGSRDDEGKS